MYNISRPMPQGRQREHVPPSPHPKKKKKGKKKVLFLTHGSFWPFYYVFLVRTVTGMFRKNFEKTWFYAQFYSLFSETREARGIIAIVVIAEKKIEFLLFISSFKESTKISCWAIQKGLPYFTLCHFSPDSFSLILFSKKWQPIKGKGRIFLYKRLLKHITLHRNKKKRSKVETFESIGAVIFTLKRCHFHT